MTKRWVVVADGSRTRIYTTEEPRGPLVEVKQLDNAHAREMNQDMDSDRPGRAFDSNGEGRHAMGASVDPVEQATVRYAREVTGYLRSACQNGRCRSLLLVAGPHLLGVLRKQLDVPPDVRIAEIGRNLGQFGARELREHLPDRL